MLKTEMAVLLCIIAAELGHGNIVTTLLDTSSTDLDVIDNDGFSPLMLAGKGGYCAIVRACLVAGTNCSPREPDDFASVLDLAARHGHTEVVKALLDYGANVNDADSSGGTALHFASHANQAGTVDVLIAAGADINASAQGKHLSTWPPSGAATMHCASFCNAAPKQHRWEIPIAPRVL